MQSVFYLVNLFIAKVAIVFEAVDKAWQHSKPLNLLNDLT